MSDNLEKRLLQFIKNIHLINQNNHLLLAVSGGIDSMVMLDLFHKNAERLHCKLSVVHINHQLRGKESDEDEHFVRTISNSYGIPCYCERVDVVEYAKINKLSKQVAARQLRYESFRKIKKQINADLIVTAHQADDNAETVLMNILRGTALHGLKGIPRHVESDSIIRPLLFARRKDIEKYANQFSIQYRNDSSNDSVTYYRNYLRHKIIPQLQKKLPDVIDILNQVAENMYSINQKLIMLVNQKINSFIKTIGQDLYLNLIAFEKEDDFIQGEILREILKKLELEITEQKINSLRKLNNYPTGRRIELGNNITVFKDRNTLVFKKYCVDLFDALTVEIGNTYEYGNFKITISDPENMPAHYSGNPAIEYVDANLIVNKNLIIRSWNEGDWFVPLGMKNKKKLSDFFADQKVPLYLKHSVPILEAEGLVVWICGMRLDDRFKITRGTKQVVKLTYQEIKSG